MPRSRRSTSDTPSQGSPGHYCILNKPYNVLSQFTPDLPGQRTLADFLLPKGLYAAGRLDKDSEGLLLLTDDGPLINRLLDPEHGHERTYLVQVEGIPDEGALTRFAEGLTIGGYHTRPAQVRVVDEPEVPARTPPIRWREAIPTCWLEVKLVEGKNRQVRRMTAAIGHPTLRLIRSAIGGVNLQGLEVGKWRMLAKSEVTSLLAPP